jgi:hypothetical protein
LAAAHPRRCRLVAVVVAAAVVVVVVAMMVAGTAGSVFGVRGWEKR